MKHGADDSLRVRFFTGPKYLPEQSRVEERDVYDESISLEYIEIAIPGGDKIVRVATPQDIKRFSELYRQWKLNEGDNPGTPLDVLGFTATQKDMCTRASIFSVEQLAAVGDHVLASIGLSATSMRRRAQEYVAGKPVANEELDKLKAQNAEMQAKLAEMTELLQKLLKDKSK